MDVLLFGATGMVGLPSQINPAMDFVYVSGAGPTAPPQGSGCGRA